MPTRRPVHQGRPEPYARARAHYARVRSAVGTWTRDRGRELGLAALRAGRRGAFRYRYELAPAGAVFGLALSVQIGHLANERSWYFAPLVVGVGGLLLGWWAGFSVVERAWSLGYMAVASVWAGFAWRFGVTAQPLGVLLVAGGLAGAVPWWLHRGVRSRIEVLDGTWNPLDFRAHAYTRATRAEGERIYAAWLQVAKDTGLRGVRVRRVVGDRWCFSIHFEVPPGDDGDRLVAAARKLETAFDAAERESIVVEPEARPRHYVARWTRAGQKRPPAMWTLPLPARWKTPITIGTHEDRTPATLNLVNQHALLGGPTGQGKTNLLRIIAAALAMREDVYLIGFDVAKRGAKLRRLGRAFNELVTEPDEVVPALQGLVRMLEERGRILAHDLTDDEWPTSARYPQVVVVVDEVAELVRIRGAVSCLETLARLGRELGLTLVLGTQHPSGEALGGDTELRRQMMVRIAFRGAEPDDGDMTLGRGAAKRGWQPSELPGPGWVLLRDVDHPVPRRLQVFLLEGDALRQAADSIPGTTKQLDARSAEARTKVLVLPRQAAAGQVPGLQAQQDTQEQLDLLYEALRHLGPRTSMRALAERAFADVNKKSWVHRTGLPLLVQQGRVQPHSPESGWVVADVPPVPAVVDKP